MVSEIDYVFLTIYKIIGPQFPAVVKVGHAHAGYGKMKIYDHHDFADFASM
jgi:hypothetical protein